VQSTNAVRPKPNNYLSVKKVTPKLHIETNLDAILPGLHSVEFYTKFKFVLL